MFCPVLLPALRASEQCQTCEIQLSLKQNASTLNESYLKWMSLIEQGQDQFCLYEPRNFGGDLCIKREKKKEVFWRWSWKYKKWLFFNLFHQCICLKEKHPLWWHTFKNNPTELQRFFLHFSESHYVDVLSLFSLCNCFFLILFLKNNYINHFNTGIVCRADIVVKNVMGQLLVKHVEIIATSNPKWPCFRVCREDFEDKSFAWNLGKFFQSSNIDECC